MLCLNSAKISPRESFSKHLRGIFFANFIKKLRAHLRHRH